MKKIKLNTTNTPERLKLVLDSTRLGMWDWSPVTDEVVFDFNWANMLGLKMSDLSMTLDDWSSRVHPDDMDACLADIKAHIEGKTEFYENMHRMRHADGSWVYILDRGRVVERDSEGKALRFTGTHADMTALKSAEFDALLATKAKERFFSSMSHELRAPLHAMLGLLEVAQNEPNVDDIQDKVKIISESGFHLLNVVNNLLDASRLQHTSLNIKRSEYDLVTLVNNAYDLFSHRAEEKQLKFAVINRLDSRQCYLLSDRSRMFQVLINLISNAIKFTSSGSVSIMLEKHDQGIAINVCDSGQGIDDIAAIYKPFFSKDVSENYDDATSTGLGLSISKEIVDTLGCKLEVQSSLGVGSTFSIVIPSCLEVKKEADERLSSPDMPRTINSLVGKTILAVDDTPINIVLLKAMLSPESVELIAVNTVQKAMDVLGHTQVDVIITDLHMPIQGGLELTKQIRASSVNQDRPIIVLSADTKHEAWPKCEAVGANAYLEKPFSSHQLVAAICELIVT